MKKLFLIFLILFCSHAMAETSVSDLYKESLFLETQQQILLMQTQELDELRDYLSSCGTNGGEIKRFFCQRSARAYILKYGQGKPVENLIIALAEVDFLIDLVDEADEKGQIDKESKQIKMQVFKDLERYSVIRDMMESAMKKAYADAS